MRFDKKLLVLGAIAVLPVLAAACEINMGGQGAQSPTAAADAAPVDPNAAAAAAVPAGSTKQIQRIDRTPRPVDLDAGAAPTAVPTAAPTTPLPSLDAGLSLDAAALNLDAAAAAFRHR
jgi:hypothetical protein